ncbi:MULTISPECIES: glycosyltransferase [unclassified Amycolatopsis]|uniref:glycosyltransferase n=1 Tax=unclassified Amycolatopsis TaxID=2618356 RepID=UPI00287724A7|nr:MULTISPECIES: glycosyltransferase [unclassified Amycolatopsis]MDS0134183.1 glycosyltransferase family 1 protein [Amycolatopsis sp. 505]MDS0146876.1 glycosyltransferase family 1 protein [Amycolatopsis sp. CM201R]
MTRVLLSTYGTRGDVEPLVALAVELRALGADVRMGTPPDEEFADRLAGLGIEQVPIGPPVRALMGATPAELTRYRAELLETQFAVLPEAAEDCDAVVAAGLAQVAARSVAEAAGRRYVYVTYSAVNLPSPHHAPPPRPGWPEPPGLDNPARWALDAQRVDAQFREPLDTHRAALGLPPVAGVRDHVYSDRPWLAADPVLGAATPDLEVVQTGAWTLPDERPLPAGLEEFLAAGPPPVYVGFGSITPAPEVARWSVAASRARGYRVLVSRGWADLAVDGCFAVGDVSHQRLFGRLAAVVHHGGAGTTQTAARAGVPQVVVPIRLADNPYWASRVAAHGVGTALENPTAESLAAAFDTALAPETRARAAALGARIRTDGAKAAARLLLDELGAVRPNG